MTGAIRMQGAAARASLAALLVAMMASAPGAQAAALYRWLDAEGVWQFSDSLPLEAPPGEVLGRPGITVGELRAAEAEAERQARLEAARRAAEERAKEQEREAALAEARRQLETRTIVSPYDCEEARQLLAVQREPRRTYYTLGEDGSFRLSTAEDQARLVAEWEQAVAELCAENVRVVRPGSEEAEAALAATPQSAE